ncbi:hypothetical protein [Bradyrhizobium sp. dw_411]|uniref:hypothetical protein n=1 Tax=Bradyrhizobium sp. dw_411 TaxID=2720082 RepID=UPI001BD077A9|nr:hypothetical protein [Bradyrhizobium sp. dw_411]
MFIGIFSLISRGRYAPTVESIELALPLERTVVEVPDQVQIAEARSRSAEMPELSRIKPLKEHDKGRIRGTQKKSPALRRDLPDSI